MYTCTYIYIHVHVYSRVQIWWSSIIQLYFPCIYLFSYRPQITSLDIGLGLKGNPVKSIGGVADVITYPGGYDQLSGMGQACVTCHGEHAEGEWVRAWRGAGCKHFKCRCNSYDRHLISLDDHKTGHDRCLYSIGKMSRSLDGLMSSRPLRRRHCFNSLGPDGLTLFDDLGEFNVVNSVQMCCPDTLINNMYYL